MRLLFSWLLGSMVAVLHAGSIAAQTGPDQFSCADTVRAALAGFEGSWKVRALFRKGPGAWDTTDAKASFRPELGGCVLEERYAGTRYGQSYEYLALWGANGWPEARVQRFFTHSRHGIFGLASGGFLGDTLILEERFTLNGLPVVQQNRYSRPSGDGFTQLGRRSSDNGATWTETLRATFRPSRR